MSVFQSFGINGPIHFPLNKKDKRLDIKIKE